jgi:hypothetical protein
MGGGPQPAEMGIAAGGRISQAIMKDPGNISWDKTQTKVFNVQILNSTAFKAVTGFDPPATPINAETYSVYGYPFYKLYDEPTSNIHGDFSNVKSIAEIDNNPESHVPIKTSVIEPHEFFNHKGPMKEFKTVQELEKEVDSQGEILF